VALFMFTVISEKRMQAIISSRSSNHIINKKSFAISARLFY